MLKKGILTSSAQVAGTLRQAIVSGELLPGARLREDEFSKEMGVSRSPIREALRVLEAEGLVNISPNKGAFVTQLNDKDIKEIHELRLLLEVHAIRIACKKITQENFKELEEIMDNMESKLKSKDYLGYIIESHKLHLFCIKKCDNERLNHLFKNIWNITLAMKALRKSSGAQHVESLEEHRKIFKALIQKSPAKAEKCLKEHLVSGYKRILNS